MTENNELLVNDLSEINNKMNLYKALLEIVKTIPGFDKIIQIYESGKHVSDYLFDEKLLNFFKGLEDKRLTDEEINEHYNKLKNDDNLLNRETKYILNIINNSNEASQTLRLSYLYLSYIKGKINSQDLFFELAEVNNRLLETDLPLLFEFVNSEHKPCDYRADRLTSLGLMSKVTNVYDSNDESYKLTELGKTYCVIMKDYYPNVAISVIKPRSIF